MKAITAITLLLLVTYAHGQVVKDILINEDRNTEGGSYTRIAIGFQAERDFFYRLKELSIEDDAGNYLESRLRHPKLKVFDRSFHTHRDLREIRIAFSAFPRSVATLRKITGRLEVYDSTLDPNAVFDLVEVDTYRGRIHEQGGMGLYVFTKEQIEFLGRKKREELGDSWKVCDDLFPDFIVKHRDKLSGIRINKPDEAVVFYLPEVEVIEVSTTVSGRKRTGGSSSYGGFYRYEFRNVMDEDSDLRIQVATKLSKKEIELDFKEVELP